jgi:hypothetical protein
VQGTGTNPDQMLTARERGLHRIRESAQGKNMNRKIFYKLDIIFPAKGRHNTKEEKSIGKKKKYEYRL